MATVLKGACAPGIWRLEQRIPIIPALRFAIKVNVYVLEMADGLCLIDCGAPSGYDEIRSTLEKAFPGKPVVRVYLTHGHFDHAGAGLSFLNDGAEVWATEAEQPLTQSGGPVGVPAKFRYPEFLPSHTISNEHEITLTSGQSVKALQSPGHTSGSVTFASPDSRVLFVGDCLFGPLWGYGITFFLEFLTAMRQPSAERRQHLETVRNLRSEVASNGLLLPGHGTQAEPGARYQPFNRTERVLGFTLRVKR